MQYTIEVNDTLNDILTANAMKSGMTTEALIAYLLNRFVIDAHIMEKVELWERGINECADINLDWANL